MHFQASTLHKEAVSQGSCIGGGRAKGRGCQPDGRCCCARGVSVTWSAQVTRVSLVPVRTLTNGAVVDDTTEGSHTTGGRHRGTGVAALPQHARLLQLALVIQRAVAGDWGCLRVRQVSQSEGRSQTSIKQTKAVCQKRNWTGDASHN